MMEPKRYPPISDYALLSDCHGAALVSRDGSIDWCCLTRFDARPVFSRLLDWDRCGYFRIAPEGEHRVSRRYVPGTNVLETRFEAEDGIAVLTDFLVIGRSDGASGQEPPEAEDRLIRRVECPEGRVRLRVEYAPRFNFGSTTPHLRHEDDDRVLVAIGGSDALVLQSSEPLDIVAEGHADSVMELEAGGTLGFVLSYSPPHRVRVQRLDDDEVEERLRRTIDFWSEWSGRCTYAGRYREAVRRSALVLKALTNVETGAMVAAPTTSLPEQVGGVRNWDYRYAWLRDASFGIEAMYRLGYSAEGQAFIEWLQRTTAGLPRQLQIMYGEGGECFLPEIRLEDVEGYRGSAPVRVGNAASEQFQLDVYGEVLHAMWRYYCHGGRVSDDEWRLLERMVEYVSRTWDRPDSGLWEVRSEPEHFVHSKALCWVAVDRAMKLAEELGRVERLDDWRRLREEILERVLRDGVRDGRFVRAFGSDLPDAASLLIPLVGLVPPDDPRSIATRRWIEDELMEDGFVRRYLGEDGLPGTEGAFLICSFWMVEHLVLSGEPERARAMFEHLLEACNDVGLLSEEIATETGDLLGNFPQALSHIGLINAALVLEDEAGARTREGEGPGPS